MGGRGTEEGHILSELAVCPAFVRSLMLLHVVLAGEGLVASWANNGFLSCVFLAVAGSVARGGESVGAAEAGGVRAWEFLFGWTRWSGGGRAGVRLSAGGLGI